MFIILPQGYFNLPAYWYNLVRRDSDLTQVLSIIKHYTDFISIAETKDKGRTDLTAMVTHVTNRGYC